jgi:hypothetical protein
MRAGDVNVQVISTGVVVQATVVIVAVEVPTPTTNVTEAPNRASPAEEPDAGAPGGRQDGVLPDRSTARASSPRCLGELEVSSGSRRATRVARPPGCPGNGRRARNPDGTLNRPFRGGVSPAHAASRGPRQTPPLGGRQASCRTRTSTSIVPPSLRAGLPRSASHRTSLGTHLSGSRIRRPPRSYSCRQTT